MVNIEFEDEPTTEDIEEVKGRIQATGNVPRGISGGRALEYDSDSETLRINFEQLSRTLIEHRMFEEAEGFSSTEMGLLRIVEQGPDRMAFSEIKSQTKVLTDDDDEPLADPTIHHYLRRLREKQLITHNHNQYTYDGP